MKKFKDWSIMTKITLPFIFIVIIFIGNYFAINHYITKTKYHSMLVGIAARNTMLSQRIAYLSEVITRGNKKSVEDLSKAVKKYDLSLSVMKNGGVPPGYNTVLPPIKEKDLPIFTTVEDQWKQFKKEVNVIISEPHITQTIDEIVGIDTMGNVMTSTNKIDIINPKIRSSIVYIETHSQNLLDESEALATKLVMMKSQNKRRLILYLAILFLFNIAFIVMAIIVGKKTIVNPMRKMADLTRQIATGNLNIAIPSQGKDNEISKMANSVNYLREKLNDKVKFILEVTKGNYNAEYKLENDKDTLGKSLLDMRESFQKAATEEQKRKEADRRQNWATQGMAQLADILRKDNDNIEELSFNIIDFLVNELKANQGGIFVINNDNKEDVHIEMTASVAFDKRKYIEKRIEMGEGLVGRCLLEEATIYMTEIPDDYIEITSGLGKATPKSLLIVPLIVNNEKFGAIEIASFKEFEQHEIDFVEKAAESIASTISSVRISSQTAKLLKESQQQAEKMARQEEEMRNTLQELRETQKEAQVQEQKLVSFTDSVNHTLIRAEYKTDGTLIYANTKFIEKLEYNSDIEVNNRHISIFIDEKDQEWFEKMWEPLSKGGKHFEGNMKHVTKNGNDIWMMATFTAVRNSKREVEKILFLAIDTTDQKKQSLDHKGQIDALELSSVKVEFHPNGKFIRANQLFFDEFEYVESELENKTIFNLVKQTHLTEFKMIWDNAVNQIPYKGDLKFLTITSKEKWFYTTLAPVKDMYDKVDKIIFIGNNITDQKQAQLQVKEQAEELQSREEELKQNMEELETAQEAMRQKQSQLEKAKTKLESNEEILKRALEKSKEREKELKEKTEELTSSEEELRQNMEELEATQEEMARKQTEVERAKKKLEANESVLKQEIKKSKEREKELKEKTEELTSSEEELRQNMEELEATQEEMVRKQTEIERAKKKLEANESVLKRAIEKSKEREKELKEKTEELTSSEEELRQNMEELEATQEEMVRKQTEIERAKKKLEANESVLKRAVEKSKEREKELKEKTEELSSSEEELRQNMEELQATQEEMDRKKTELEKAKKKLEANESVLKRAIEKSKEREEVLKGKEGQLEKVQKKLEANEQVLKKAVLKAKTQQKELTEQNRKQQEKFEKEKKQYEDKIKTLQLQINNLKNKK